MRSQDHATEITAVTSGWQPIASAPKDGTSILILVTETVHQGSYQGPSDGAIYSGSASRYNWFCETSCRSIYDLNVTHWMPLPPAPSSAKPLEGDSSRDTSTLPPQASEGTP